MAAVEMMPDIQLGGPAPPKSSPQANQFNRGKKSLKLDPLRALEPARKKLSTVEAQRVLACLEETKKRVELVSLFPKIVENLDRFSTALGSDLVQRFTKHNATMTSYDELNSTIKTLIERKKQIESAIASEDETDQFGYMDRPGSGTSRKSNASMSSVDYQLDSALRSLEVVQQQLSSSCKDILRGFALNPAAVTSILSSLGDQSDQSASFIAGLARLKDIILEKLLTTPTEEHEKTRYLQQVTQQERYNAAVIEKMATELKAGMDDKEHEISKKNDIIRRLQGDLHQIEKFSEEHIRRVTTDAEKQEASDEKNSEGKKQKLQAEINTQKTQLQNLVVEHRESEQDLRKRKYKVETEVENWITKYDSDIGDKQDEYERIDEIYTEEKKQLNELEERFNTLETEYNQIQEERRIARERREAAERELQMMIKAATTVQAFWRSYKVRKTLKAKKKGGKGKKGKGKKK